MIRKPFGYAHIPQRWASLINPFNHETVFPYINFHRPCFFPRTITDSKSKDKKFYLYNCMMTPYDKLKSLENTKTYLKLDIKFEVLDTMAISQTDDQAAEQLQKERCKLFKTINETRLKKLLSYRDLAHPSDSFFYWKMLFHPDSAITLPANRMAIY